MAEKTKLEAMLVHLLISQTPTGNTGRPWAALQPEGYPKFTRDDVKLELAELRCTPRRHWYSWLLGK